MSPRYFGELEAGWGGRGRQRHLQLAGAPGSHVPRIASWWVSCIHRPTPQLLWRETWRGRGAWAWGSPAPNAGRMAPCPTSSDR